jgi:hypothetical protein
MTSSIVVRPGQLERAVRQAPAGAVLHLSAEEHRLSGPLKIDRPLSLIGEGMDNTQIMCGLPKESASFAGVLEGGKDPGVMKFVGRGQFRAHDLSFEYQGSRKSAHVVHVVAHEIDIQRCRFTSGYPSGSHFMGLDGLAVRGQTKGLVALGIHRAGFPHSAPQPPFESMTR